MANSDGYPVRAREPELWWEFGKFVTVNDANPTSFSGFIRSVTWLAEGRWTITLKRKYPQLHWYDIKVVGTAQVRGYLEAADVKTAGTLTIQLTSNAEALADAPGSTVFLALAFGNTNVTRR